jgi:flagellar biosynthesis protein
MPAFAWNDSPLMPRSRAVALAYQDGDTAPRIVAKGRGELADKIVELARQHGVAIHESIALVELLDRVALNDAIPPALYRAVAELLVWLHQIERAQVSNPA